jgi:hypothetical protein
VASLVPPYVAMVDERIRPAAFSQMQQPIEKKKKKNNIN